MNKNIKIKDCNNCPFKTVEIDDYNMGDLFTVRCNMLIWENNDDDFLENIYGSSLCKDNYIHKNCPLKDKELNISLKNGK